MGTTVNVYETGSSIAGEIRRYRAAKKLTQKEFGALIGVTGDIISRYECGHVAPRYKRICKIRKVVASKQPVRAKITKPKPTPKGKASCCNSCGSNCVIICTDTAQAIEIARKLGAL